MRSTITRSPRRRVALAAAVLAATGAFIGCAPSGAAQADVAADSAAIHDLIAEHYVAAVFETRDEAAARRAFHPSFTLFVLDDGGLIVAPLDMWLERLGLDGEPSGDEVRHELAFIDVAGDAAVTRTELFINGEHVYTDYFSLYRFPADGWQIVTKTFQSGDE